MLCFGFTSVLVNAPTALAQEQEQEQEQVDETGSPTDAYRDDARRLATEAAERYGAGEFAAALDLFVRAGKLYDAPTLQFWQALCLENLGRLVEAEARYAEVARTEIHEDTPEAFVKAKRDSEQALEQLRKRLPTIKVIITHAKDISNVELDGRVLPPPLVGAPVAVDPGTHVVKVTRSSGIVRTESVAIVESQAEEVYVDFDLPERTPLDPLTSGTEKDQPAVRTWRSPVGYASLAIGGLGMTMGVVAGLRAMDKHRTLEDECPDDRCPPEVHAEVDSFHTWRTVSTVGYALGVLGLGTGVVLLLTDNESGTNTALTLGPNGASLGHHF